MEFLESPLRPKSNKKIHTSSAYLSAPSKNTSIDEYITKNFYGSEFTVQKAYKNIRDCLFQALFQKSKKLSDTAIIVHYPQDFSAQEINTTIRDWATTTFLTHFSWDVDLVVEEERGKDYYPYYTTYVLSFVQKKVVSVVFHSYRYTGGAYDTWEEHSLSFDLATGKPITREQLFPSPESIQKTSKWLTVKVLKGREAAMMKTRTYDIVSEKEITSSDIVMDHIILLPEGLRIFFDPYIKSSFAMGTTTITIPRSEFKNLGIAETFWQ